MNKTVRDIDLSDSNLLRNCENIFKEPSEKSIPKKVVTRSKQKRHSSVNLQKRCMKNNKPTHFQEEIIKQGKVVCGLESTEELLEEEVVCTTSLKHEEPNKWSHDQNENEAEIHQTGSQEAASHDQGNSFSLADDMLNHSFEMMPLLLSFFHNLCLVRKEFVLTRQVYILLQDSWKANPVLVVQNT